MKKNTNKWRVTTFLFAAGFPLVIWFTSRTTIDANARGNGLTALMQTSRPEKTVEQTRPNIQVLKGLPESQLYPVMWFIRASLGVPCDYCHVKQGPDRDKGWLWDRDDKPQKARAREMMRMVMDINKTSFGGNQVVTCYSCHRGTTRPEQIVPLPPLFVSPNTPTTAAGKPAAPVTAEQILNTYIKAIGGQDAAAKLKTIVYTGSIQRSEDRNDAVEITMKGTDKYLVKITRAQGTFVQGIDGAAGWVKDNNGSRKMASADVEQVKQRAVVYRAIKVAEPPAQMRVLGLEKLGDRDAYVLAVTTGPQTTRKYFFDAQTGLLVRMVTIKQTMLVPLPEQMDFEDYRDVGGVKLPFTMLTSDVDVFSPATRKFTDIKPNVAIDDTVFRMPASQK
jgi:photosynthetic reaction center cytochrome c subunit